MLIRILFTFTFIGVLAAGSAETSPSSLFEDANKLYDAQSYDSSLALYKMIEESGMVSAELFQNMGTAAYKLELVPDAVYYFEKGLKLNPGSDDLKHNLELANERITDRTEEISRSGIGNWLSSTIGGHADQWSTIAVVFSILGALFFLSYLFLKIKWVKLIGVIGGISSWILMVVFVIISYLQYNIATDSNFAILFEPSIEVRNDPSEAASIAFVLHEGSKLKILDANENWYKISFGKGKVGWLPKNSIKVI